MKRFWVIVLALSVLIAGFAMAATDILDLSIYSTDELLQLRRQITEEINTRTSDISNDENQIYSGSYYVGSDIGVGGYLITCYSPYPYDCEIFLYESTVEKPNEYHILKNLQVYDDNSPCYFELHERMLLKVKTQEPAYMVKKDTDFSWAR